ncbi:glycoside hydrolase family 5 [Caldicellulosiruptor owensensis OL]|uniref:cellulase n=1 Tax=Caldicellulosiruptor owensensis (strain ATCC 700167 / DSM 13100 / OL) TaxID=632518 RepID=E4Q408_CALOW|nr:cellulase family glycosylhydrolase [Caldicellulosiruptor owensensis]ADQ04043.1 glycoside hydrolase family 5 [Caldicellulosiruptor owensensis OL]
MKKIILKSCVLLLMAIFTISILQILNVFAQSMPYEKEEYPHLLGNQAVKKPSVAGRLQIIEKDGKKYLADQKGKIIQLRGMSTHGLQWYGDIINKNAFEALSKDWECNVVRLAMYVGEGGYASNPNLKEKVIEGIKLAIENDMYVIVDWHVLNPGDPNAEIYKGAKDFFKEIATSFPNDYHIIYELCNEPNSNEPGVENSLDGWKKVKAYAQSIIKMLRSMGNQNIIIVGSPNWSQRPDFAIQDPINDKNVMYSVHFYSGTHKVDGYVFENMKKAFENGVPIFVSEWGTSLASGDGGPYLDEADKWLEYLNANYISWVNWSLSNKNETSAAFVPYISGMHDATSLDPGDDKMWDIKELSISGEYVRARIKGVTYEPVRRDIGMKCPFKDVSEDNIFYEHVVKLYSKGIIKGTSSSKYLPDKNITRAEFAALCVRALNLEIEKYDGSFSDVKSDTWYSDVVYTAYKNGLFGQEKNRFFPERIMKREETAALAIEVYKRLTGKIEVDTDDIQIADEELIDPQYRESVKLAVQLGIIDLVSDGTFAPDKSVSRGEAATIMYNILNLSGKL